MQKDLLQSIPHDFLCILGWTIFFKCFFPPFCAFALAVIHAVPCKPVAPGIALLAMSWLPLWWMLYALCSVYDKTVHSALINCCVVESETAVTGKTNKQTPPSTTVKCFACQPKTCLPFQPICLHLICFTRKWTHLWTLQILNVTGLFYAKCYYKIRFF